MTMPGEVVREVFEQTAEFDKAHADYLRVLHAATVAYIDSPAGQRGPVSSIEQRPDVIAAQQILTVAENALFASYGYQREDLTLHPFDTAE